MKILIIGHKQHGKTTLAEMIAKKLNITFLDSSIAAAKIFLYDKLKDKYGYKSFEECHADRRNHRKEWYDEITNYNKKDRSRLAKEILAKNDMYVGMRNIEELHKCKEEKLFDLIIGIFRPEHELETVDSFNINIFKESDFIIYNNGTLKDLEKKVDRIFGNLK